MGRVIVPWLAWWNFCLSCVVQPWSSQTMLLLVGMTGSCEQPTMSKIRLKNIILFGFICDFICEFTSPRRWIGMSVAMWKRKSLAVPKEISTNFLMCLLFRPVHCVRAENIKTSCLRMAVYCRLHTLFFSWEMFSRNLMQPYNNACLILSANDCRGEALFCVEFNGVPSYRDIACAPKALLRYSRREIPCVISLTCDKVQC